MKNCDDGILILFNVNSRRIFQVGRQFPVEEEFFNGGRVKVARKKVISILCFEEHQGQKCRA